jgi:site-specific recombinase XerD
MARPPKPWFREQTGWWMVYLDGKPEKLSTDKDEAHRKFHAMMATRHEVPESPNASVADVVEAFLSWASTHTKTSTYEQYAWYGQKLAEDCGRHAARDFKPIHVTRWIEKRGWHGSHEYNAKRYVFRYFSWAVHEGIFSKNPLAGMKRSKPLPRQRAITEVEYLSLLRATDSDFRPLLFALRQTGARPSELRELKWENVRGDHLSLWEHKVVGKTRKPRVIHLTPCMQRFLGVVRKRSRSEYVFLNAKGRPWTMDAVRQRVARLKAKLGLSKDVCTYLIRHAFGTNAVLNGVDVATVAELMGHSSTEVTTGVYVHLAGQKSHLQNAVSRAVSKPPGASTRRDA